MVMMDYFYQKDFTLFLLRDFVAAKLFEVSNLADRYAVVNIIDIPREAILSLKINWW